MFNNNRNMMKNILLIGGFLFLGLQNMSALAPSKKAVEGVIERTVGHLPANVKWSIHPDRARGTYFRYEAKDGKLFLKGSDPKSFVFYIQVEGIIEFRMTAISKRYLVIRVDDTVTILVFVDQVTRMYF